MFATTSNGTIIKQAVYLLLVLLLNDKPVFWIRMDPDSNCQAGSESGSVYGIRILKVKLSLKTPLFPQIFHDFHQMIPNKSSLFYKIPTFWVENKNFSKNFVFAFKRFVCFSGLDPDQDWGKIQDPDP